MGTSKSISTPTGGDWSNLKREITEFIGGDERVTPENIVGRTVAAAGGISNLANGFANSRGGGGGGGGGGRSGGGSSRAGTAGSSGSGRAVSGLGGFGSDISSGGLGVALDRLGLNELRGKTAVEVIARVAEQLAGDVEGLSREILTNALRDSILEAAALEGDTSYENLDGSLQAFLNREGPEGLVGAFLTHLVFDQVWCFIENHVDSKTDGSSIVEAMASAVEGACRSHVQILIDDSKKDGTFQGLDWFGREGIQLGQDIVSDLSSRVSRLANTEGT